MSKLSSTTHYHYHYHYLHSLVFLITFSKLFLATISRTFPDDVQVLKDLKNGVDPHSIPPGSCLSSWDFSLDPCDHIFTDHFTCGLRCDINVSAFARVTEISIDPVGYSGSLTSTSWNLPYLQTLDISDNSFSGSIPESISNLTRLRRLTLSRNSLTGNIPIFLATLSHLEELYLDNNNLNGPIPSTFNNLTSLRRLEVQQNNIYGEFPNLGSLKNLYFLDASDNNMSGGVPETLPPSLVELSIRNNKLGGNIPHNNINKMRFLQVLDLSHNMISGTISSALFDHPSLEQLTLAYNNFSSLQVPDDLGLNSYLIALDLSYNQLRGFLPAFMASMPRLAALSLEHNKFSGMIPANYALKAAITGNNTSSFQRLLLGGNYLFGPIPGPLLRLKPGSVDVSLVDNCLYRCPDAFFFCQGADQKSLVDCKSFGCVIP